MSTQESFDTKEQVRQASDIVDVVGGFLELRRQGRNYVALCPWHNDSKPSLQVNAERQSWRCWVCGIGGDVFSFVMRREGVDFREALELLADKANIQIKLSNSNVPAGSPGDKRTLFAAMAWAEKQFYTYLNQSSEADVAREYLQQRGITQKEIDQFHIGFSPNSWSWLADLAKSTEFSPAVLEKVGLLGKSPKSGRHYDWFRGRVLFPIRDTQSRPIALGGRVLPQFADDKSGKYVNSPETRLFSKSDNLYALDLARDSIVASKQVVVVEGYTDVIALHQAGITNAVAVLGTALGPRHIQLLRRYADQIYLVLDGDEAGQKRTNEILELFVAEQVDLRIMTLPDGLDPCDFVQQQGPEVFRQHLTSAVDALEHKVRISTHQLDPVRDIHRANEALEDLLGTLANSPRLSGQTTSEVRLREQQFLSRMARQFQVEETELRTRLTALRRATRKPARSQQNPMLAEKVSAADLEMTERWLLEILTQNEELAIAAVDEINIDELDTEAAKSLYRIYQTLVFDRVSCDFARVLTETEDPLLKNLLVELDEQAAEKNVTNTEDQLKQIIEAYRRRTEDRQQRQNTGVLERQEMDDKEELDLLNQIIEQQRNRQGISSPTDG
ncbi:MAG: DNA primase [Pirellulales bacterium]